MNCPCTFSPTGPCEPCRARRANAEKLAALETRRAVARVLGERRDGERAAPERKDDA